MIVRKSLVALVLALAWLGCSDPETRKQSYMDVGTRAFERGDYRTASVVFRKAIQMDRSFAEAYYWAGRADARLGRMAQAMGQLRRAFSLEPAHPEAFHSLANVYLRVFQSTPVRRRQLMEEMNALFEEAAPYHRDTFQWNRVRGQFLLLQGKFDEAQNYLAAAVAASEEPTSALVLSWAQALAGAKREDEAIQLLQEGIGKDPSFEPFYNVLYQLHLREGRAEAAEQALISKTENNPQNIRFALDLARHYGVNGEMGKMQSTLDRITPLLDEKPSGYALLGDFLHEIEEYDRALEAYNAGIEKAPDQKNRFRKKIARTFAERGQDSEALAMVNEVLDDAPEDAAALASRGVLRLREGGRSELDRAIEDLRASVAQDPNNARIRYQLGVAYTRSGRLEESIGELREAVRLEPGFVTAMYELARVLTRIGDHDRATATLSQLLRRQPKHAGARILMAQHRVTDGQIGQAREILNEVLTDFPQHRGATLALGQLDLQQKQYAAAEARYRRMVAERPNDIHAVLGLATSLIVQRKLLEADRLLTAAIAKAPESLALHQSMANLKTVKQDHAGAVESLQVVLNLAPRNIRARLQLAQVYERMGRTSEAESEYRKAAEISPDSVAPLLRLAALLERNGNPLEALPLYEKVLTLAPNNVMAMTRTAKVLADLGEDPARAMQLAESARRARPDDPVVTDTLAWVYLQRGMARNAIPLLEGIVEQSPQNALYRYHLSLALEKAGMAARAQEERRTALRLDPSVEQREGGRLR